FARIPGARRGRALDHTSFVMIDDGECLSYILTCENMAGSEEPAAPAHAFHHLAAVWLDVSDVEPLQLARTLDALIRQAQLPTAEWREMTICVRQTLIDPLVKRRLEAQFQTIRYGIELEEFLALTEPKRERL